MRIVQTLVPSQIKGGFLDLLKEAQKYFPQSETSISLPIYFDNDDFPDYKTLSGWKYKTPMITGLTQWFKIHSAAVGDKVIIEIEKDRYRLIYSSRVNNENGLDNNRSAQSEQLGYQRADYDRAIKLNSNDGEAWFNKGVAFLNLKMYQDSVSCFDQVIRINPKDGDAWYNKAYCLGFLGMKEEQIECCNKALEINPANFNALGVKAIALCELGRYFESFAASTQSIAINHNFTFGWINKALALEHLNQYEEALESFQMVSLLDPAYEKAWVHKGWLLTKLGLYQEAVEQLTRALELDPNDKEALGFKQDAFEKMHQGEINAQKHYFILPGRNSLEIWSEKRLSFEPKDWLLSLRNEIRSGLTAINCNTEQVLHATYISAIEELCDLDNILFYNVGTEYFQQTGYAGLRLERSFLEAPPPPSNSNLAPVKHYQRYMVSLKQDGFENWIQTRTLVKWKTNLTSSDYVRFKVSRNPAYVWRAIKSGIIKHVSEFQNVNRFGLRLKIVVPKFSSSTFIDVVKPFLDGTVGAFHKHDGSNEELIVQELSSILEIRAQDVISYLSDETFSALGSRTLFWVRQNGIQWNPADDCCVAAEFLFEKADRDTVDFSGELFQVIENTEEDLQFQSDKGNPKIIHHEYVLNQEENPDCTRPSNVSHLNWKGCKECFNWKCGHSTCIEPTDDRRIEQGALCPFEHCIENFPVDTDPETRCNIFGHICPGGTEYRSICIEYSGAVKRRLERRSNQTSGFGRMVAEEFSTRHPNSGKFIENDMKFCKAILARFGRGEHMWVVITKIAHDGIEGWIDNEPKIEGSPKYGEHVFVRYKEIEDVS